MKDVEPAVSDALKLFQIMVQVIKENFVILTLLIEAGFVPT
jgi:hypothetical protein